MKTRKLKDLKENECIKVNTLKEAKYFIKLFNWVHDLHPETLVNNFITEEDNEYYVWIDSELDTIYPASDFIKPKRKNKLKAKVSKIEKELNYLSDIVANMNRVPSIVGKIEIVKFPENDKPDVYKTEITELPGKWCVEDSEIVSKWANERFGFNFIRSIGVNYLHVNAVYNNVNYIHYIEEGYTLISPSDFERLVLNKEQIGNSEKLEVGKWYRMNDYPSFLGFVTTFRSEENDTRYYGFNTGGAWTNDDYYENEDGYRYFPASNKEVEAALIAEAKKRGFKEGVTHNIANGERTIKNIKCERFTYDEYGNKLLLNNWCVFEKGKWAEIIQEKEIDFSVDGQLVMSENMLVITTGNHAAGSFEGIVIKDYLNDFSAGSKSMFFSKEEFKPFEGEVTIKIKNFK